MSQDFLDERRQALEDSFFRKRDAELLDKIKRHVELASKRNALAMVSGIKDQKLLDRLISLEMTPDTVAALSLVPMVEVAWADGKLEDRERDAILDAAVQAGMDKADPSYHWLLTWLESPPDEELRGAWEGYVRMLCTTLDEDDRKALKKELVQRARQVATSAGSILGLTNPISQDEEKVLDRLNATLES